ncbi:MAG: hypothetical protein HYV62_15860 [Candidatus Rokubacteria bacterium]|nr:hypothetical protein [Candidatus Rokubacteria bacterium]
MLGLVRLIAAAGFVLIAWLPAVAEFWRGEKEGLLPWTDHPLAPFIGLAVCATLIFLWFHVAMGLLQMRGWIVGVCAGAIALGGLVSVLLVTMPNVTLKARLAADQGTLAAMRSAIAIYYGQHGTFPDHPGHYVNPGPPNFVCVNLAYVYSPMTGDLKITSANNVTECP